MAGKGRVVHYSTEETLRAVLEGQSDESELEVSDTSDVESDHLSDPSDHSDTESAPTLPNDENARNQVDVPPEPQNEPRRGRGRGRGVGRNRGQARGRGQRFKLPGERKILPRMCLSPRMELFGRLPHQIEVDVAFKT